MTMAQRKKRYRLYAMGRTRKTEEIAYDTRFYRICAGYILLYLTGRKKPEGTVEVAGADLDRLEWELQKERERMKGGGEHGPAN